MSLSDAVKDRLRIAFFVGIVLATFIVVGLMSGVPTVQMSADGGVADLSQADFSGRVYAINGGWRHFREAFRLPESMRDEAGTASAPGSAYGSYYLRILLPDDERYVMNLVSIGDATRLYVNGLLLDEIGQVDASRERAVPRSEQPDYDVYPKDGQLEIALQYANHWHDRGGDSTAITVGTPRMMAQRQARHAAYGALLMGYLLTAFLLFVGFYVTQPGVKGHLYFALMCLLIMIRQGLTGDKLFATMFPAVPWGVLLGIEYLDMCLFVSVATLYVGALFPGMIQKPVRTAVHGVTALYMLIVLLFDSRVYTYLRAWYLALLALAIAYYLARLAIRHKSLLIEQHLSVFGTVCFFAAALGEMAMYRLVPVAERPSFPLVPTAMVMFVLTQGNSMFIVQRRRLHEANRRVAAAEARYEEAIRTRDEKPQVTLSDFGLTRRESQVAYLLIDGKSRIEIADSLDISLGTVNTYCSRIYQKTGIAGRDELIRLLLTRNDTNKVEKPHK